MIQSVRSVTAEGEGNLVIGRFDGHAVYFNVIWFSDTLASVLNSDLSQVFQFRQVFEEGDLFVLFDCVRVLVQLHLSRWSRVEHEIQLAISSLAR